VENTEIARPAASPVPREFLDDAATLTGAFTNLAERFPDFECLTFLDRHQRERRLSLGTIWRRAKDVQAALEARGLERGERVVLILPTGSELIAAYFAVMMAGGVPALAATPSNRVSDPRLYTALVAHIVSSASARALLCEAGVAGLFGGAAGGTLGRTALVRPDEVGSCGSPPETRMPVPEDVATIQYSSGSTGTPKGILLSHRAMLNNIRAVRDGLDLAPDDISVNWIPLYHDMGLIDAFLLPLLGGSPTVLIPTMDFMREPTLWLRSIHRYRGTLSWAPNFAYALCASRVAESELEGLDLSSWRIAINAAEPVLARTIEIFTRRFARYGFAAEAMTPAWGLAENVTIATAHPVGEAPLAETIDRRSLALENRARTTSGAGLASVAIGRCLPHCELEIREPGGGAVLEDRCVGEVWLRSDSLFLGYDGLPKLTAESLVDGWVRTGDEGYISEGQLYFVSRDKDLIVIGGDKYVPHDVEAIINEVPGVRQGCAVAFGVMNEERGTEELAAVVETRQEDPRALSELSRAIRTRVARSIGLGMRHLELVPPGGIEKTTSGKLARKDTYRRYAEVFSDECR
jgi:acyl-CoA synthetase (AMP-forming)/AMP-acid ligase II